MGTPPGTVLSAVSRPPTAQDLALALIAQVGPTGAGGRVVEFRGDAVRALSMADRRSLCAMATRTGAVAALIAPDQQTVRHLRQLPLAPRGAAWRAAVANWRQLRTDPAAHFDRTVHIDVG